MAKQPSSKPKLPTDKPGLGSHWDRYGDLYQIGALSLLKGFSDIQSQIAGRAQYGTQAMASYGQAKLASLNAELTNIDISNAFRTGEYQAMVQGLADAERIAKTRVSTASRGVQLGSGSAAEVEATQRMNAAINQYVIHENTMQAVMNARTQKANLEAQAIIAEGDARAAERLSRVSKGQMWSSVLQAGAQFAAAWYGGGFGTASGAK